MEPMDGMDRREPMPPQRDLAEPAEPELTCSEFVELVTDYLEGALTPAERARFERHLALCPGCDTYFAQIQETAATAGRIEEEHLTEPARTRLLDAFRTWKGS